MKVFDFNKIYQALFEEHVKALLLIDKVTGKIIHANQSAIEFYGYSLEEITTLTMSNLYSSNLKEIEAISDSQMQKENGYEIHRLKSGKLCPVIVNRMSINIHGNSYVFIMISESDTKYKQHIMMSEIFYESPDPSLIIGEEGQITAVNKNYTKLFGYTESEMKNQSVFKYIEKNMIDKATNNIEKVMSGESINVQTTRRTKDNHRIHVSIIVTPYIFDTKVVGALMIFKDISKEIALENELIQLKESNNQEIKDSREHLQLILDSTAEGIYGLDLDGNCTFCNKSGLRILGYDSPDELLGKKIHNLIHHTAQDGSPVTLKHCKIMQSLKGNKGIHSENEIFWRKDETYFNVEYDSFPQFKNGEVVGAVVTFIDNTKRKENEEYIRFLSLHDSLTNLYNRKYFEDKLKECNQCSKLPISVIFGDINGLKLTNDVFGHAEGDKLLQTTADILKNICPQHTVARVGGDEFAIILCETSGKEARAVVKEIEHRFNQEDSLVIKASISLGYATKGKSSEDIHGVIKDAEGYMYKQKLLSHDQTNVETVDTIVTLLHQKSEYEKQHAINVSELCHQMGLSMDKNDNELRKLKSAGYLHDIGKISIPNNILEKGSLSSDETKVMREHPVTGYRILNLFDHTIDLAEGVLDHHEYWNGSGYPKGLKEYEIPELARIIAIAEAYDNMTNRLGKMKLSKEDGLKEIKNQSGVKYDPQLVETFDKMLNTTRANV